MTAEQSTAPGVRGPLGETERAGYEALAPTSAPARLAPALNASLVAALEVNKDLADQIDSFKEIAEGAIRQRGEALSERDAARKRLCGLVGKALKEDYEIAFGEMEDEIKSLRAENASLKERLDAVTLCLESDIDCDCIEANHVTGLMAKEECSRCAHLRLLQSLHPSREGS